MSHFARALGRVSGRMLRRNRYIDAGIEAGKVTAAHTARAARSLWYQVTGFLFCVVGAIVASVAIREYNLGAEPWRVWLAAGFAVLFAYFGITAFWRARK